MGLDWLGIFLRPDQVLDHLTAITNNSFHPCARKITTFKFHTDVREFSIGELVFSENIVGFVMAGWDGERKWKSLVEWIPGENGLNERNTKYTIYNRYNIHREAETDNRIKKICYNCQDETFFNPIFSGGKVNIWIFSQEKWTEMHFLFHNLLLGKSGDICHKFF